VSAPDGPDPGPPTRGRGALVPDGIPGRALLLFDWIGTALFAVAAVAGVVAPSVFRWPAVVVSLALFAAGLAGFVAAFLLSVSRSRFEVVTTPGVYFLSGSAPSGVRGRFWLLLGAQTVVALATASIRPFTSVAFGILVPTFGLGLMALWGARYGTFAERSTRGRSRD
jgi:hypothetical protein